MAQALGIVDAYWNGVRIDTEKGSTIKLPGYKNNVVNAGRTAFRTQEWMHGEVKLTTVIKRGQSLAAYNSGGEGELQVICDTGQTITTPDAFIVDNPTSTGGEGGKLAIDWNFSTYEELVS